MHHLLAAICVPEPRPSELLFFFFSFLFFFNKEGREERIVKGVYGRGVGMETPWVGGSKLMGLLSNA